MSGAVLAPIAALYGAAVTVRAHCYSRGWLRPARAAVPVISIGNLVAGGTGKTPMVAFAARLLREVGLRPAVVSRGYLGRRPIDPLIVSAGSGPEPGATAALAGDEPIMLARLLTGIPVVVARRRAEGASLAVSRLGARCIVLDDGFQHLALHRDLDVVLLDRRRPFDTGRLLPAGLLREAPVALRRSDAIVLTGEGEVSAASRSRLASLARPGTPFFDFGLEPTLILGADGASRPARAAAGLRAVAFAGIARPERLRATLESLGVTVVSFLPFPDHHVFAPAGVRRILEAARRHPHDLLITTEKDLARIESTAAAEPLARAGLSALRMEGTLAGGEREAFVRLLEGAAGSGRRIE